MAIIEAVNLTRYYGDPKAVLVSPLSRFSVFLGKVLGEVNISIIEAFIIPLFGYIMGVAALSIYFL